MQRCTEGLLGLRWRLGSASEAWVQTASLTWVGHMRVAFRWGKLNFWAYYLGGTPSLYKTSRPRCVIVAAMVGELAPTALGMQAGRLRACVLVCVLVCVHCLLIFTRMTFSGR